MTMLELDRVHLDDLATALEDHSPEHAWSLDPRTGDVIFGHDTDDPEEVVPVEPIDSGEAYGDMEDFIARVSDRRAHDLLGRAIEGRGAFRRFKDTLLEFPELREAWFAFHDARMRRRAIDWLRYEGLVDESAARRALEATPDPDLPALAGGFDAMEVARAVARDLAELYGDRLDRVVLFGSWARRDAHPESDIDLLVVLDDVPSRWTEMDRMHEIMWEHSFANDTVVSEIPVSRTEWESANRPLLIRARAEGMTVT
jgi:predicted nucleotidyltransferase